MQKLVLNSTQIPNIILDEIMPLLTDSEFRVLMVIARQTYGWHKEVDRLSYSQLVHRTGNSNGAIAVAVRSLRGKGYIKVLDEKGKQLFTKEECRGKDLYYQINVTSPEIGEHISRNRTPESGDTKETNTKVSLYNRDRGIAKMQTSCPLLNGSPLKVKYPSGHTECIDYLLSVEERRGYKFINKGKQFKCIHSILKAGFGFDAINKSFPLVEKKYGRGNWDFSVIVNWLEKGSANA